MHVVAANGQNVALVTQTLMANASSVLSRPEALTLPRFLDLCSLCEAAVLLDRMEALGASNEYVSGLSSQLAREGLYRTFVPTLPRDELRRMALRLPDELAMRVAEGSGDDPSAASETGAVAGLDYAAGLNNLLAQVDGLGSFASAGEAVVKERMYRGNGYLVVAAAHGLDYFPDFDRVPFVAGTLQKTYRSLPRQLYDRIAESLQEPLTGGDVVAEWTAMSTIPIPPIAALVLSRASGLDDIPEQVLRVRDEFSGFRRYFADFKAELQAADTIRERRKLLARYRTLLEEASGPGREAVSVTEMLNLTEKAVAVAAAPAVPTSYGALLVTQPIDWISRWWRRRPLAILFRLDSKMPKLSEYQQLAARLWGPGPAARLHDHAAAHGVAVQRLLSEVETTIQ
ncbi:hypothetical protein SAMN05216284_116114 [Micromonospora sediminimaris]|uniref:Uncharacterized protein n=1 Tax=Micromonospora sediminimaris TaxID=547162 RepID=A0A9W5UT36_9ACTN|nr:hypothetical protein Vse01_37500 [Micromonospora sediminimaris]SFD41406.1 hypothetical protein SAMN05216284_116114 [Micromonospora sediminimaris]